MHAIVSLLDNTYYERVEQLWAELKRKFGVQGVYATPYPHFSYHIASHYDLDKLLQSSVTCNKKRGKIE
jgi:hypothetical protein